MAGTPAPLDYVELILCRDVYHCTPPELANIPLRTILRHLACLEGESKGRELLRKQEERKMKAKSRITG